MSFDLSRHVFRLLQQEPFFTALSRHIEKYPSTAVPTAGVRINPDSGRFELIYNPDFLGSLTDEELTIVLKHEYLHLCAEHVTERLPEEGMNRTWNEATDAAINGEIFPKEATPDIQRLFDMAILPEKLDMPRGHNAEWYYKALKEQKKEQEDNKDEQKQSGQGDGSPGQGEGEPSESQDPGRPSGFDNHDGWSEDGVVPEEVKELAKQRLKEAMQEAAQEAMQKGWGNMSASMRKQIIDALTPKINWRKVLRYFVKTSQKADKISSVKKINRRFPYIHSGRKTSRTAKIAISIDQSGSVSDAMLAAFYAELNSLSSLAEFTVVPFDTRVAEDKVYIWKKGEKRKRERVLYGGTDFNAPTKWVNEHNFDGHIILTDMCAPKPVPSRCQRMWVTDKESARSQYFTTNERVIAIDTD